jgi:hypothetical protein
VRTGQQLQRLWRRVAEQALADQQRRSVGIQQRHHLRLVHLNHLLLFFVAVGVAQLVVSAAPAAVAEAFSSALAPRRRCVAGDHHLRDARLQRHNAVLQRSPRVQEGEMLDLSRYKLYR